MTTPAPTQRRLVLMRHAQAESFADDDHGRELTARGTADAGAAGTWLSEQGIVVDHAVVSSATRTRQTFAAMRAGAGSLLEPDIRIDLYSAGPESALDELRLCPDESTTLLLVGHNPTVALLANLLQDGAGDPVAEARLAQGYPPATITVLTFDGNWDQLSFGDCRLLDVHTARA
ncbi:SixA phosphatase family protein [Nocardioides yefusunii]|uniref:SixA phosphatase family protein n=1 Tax=Nocardioides yefusunii TaxID=2500546 RepID=A0ABW1QV73_9ACTN|nr:histidine phosphatase family protein [Nocardioides yefusunii]